MESCYFESWSAPLAPPHFEKSGYAPFALFIEADDNFE